MGRPSPRRQVSIWAALSAHSCGLALSYAISALPASTAVIGLAACAYAAAGIWSRVSAGEAG
jgi:hypothetical protein